METKINMFKVGFFQFNPEFGRVTKNLGKVLDALKHVTANLVVLPELPFTGYFFKDRRELANLAEPVEGSTTIETLKHLCQERSFHLVTGFAEKANDKIYNSALLIGPEGIVGTYRKLHLFNTEKYYFDPGNRPLNVVSVGDVKVGMMICFDWAFPETARLLALKGADIICHPANLVLTHCQRAMRTRSLENGVFAVTANRYGTEIRTRGELTFTGGSQITDPKGDVFAQANTDGDQLTVVEIDITQARDKRITANNDRFKDRRPQFYAELITSAGP